MVYKTVLRQKLMVQMCLLNKMKIVLFGSEPTDSYQAIYQACKLREVTKPHANVNKP